MAQVLEQGLAQVLEQAPVPVSAVAVAEDCSSSFELQQAPEPQAARQTTWSISRRSF
jgi:hypothetical protein